MSPLDGPDPTEAWDLVADEAEGLLSSVRIGAGDEEETVEVLALWQQVRRFVPGPERSRLGEALARTARRFPAAAIAGALESRISAGGWCEDRRGLAEAVREAAEGRREPGVDLAEEALRLLRLLDRWRLACLGAARAARSEGVSEPAARIGGDLEESCVRPLLGRAELFADAAPYAVAYLEAAGDDLEDDDPELFSTLDIFAAVANAASAEVDAPSARRLLARWQGAAGTACRGPRLSTLLPRPTPALAADRRVVSRAVGFEWEGPGSAARAVLDVPATPARGERTHLALLVLRRETRLGPDEVRRVRLFGSVRPLAEGRAEIPLAELRRLCEAWEQQLPGTPTLEVEDATGTWAQWPMIAPWEEGS